MRWFWIALLVFVVAACSSAERLATGTSPVVEVPTEEPFFAPDFSLMSLDGDTVTLSDLRGKWVIINFWATWCGPCVDEMPELQALANEYSDQVILLGINNRESSEEVARFREEHHLTFPLLLNPDDATLVNYQVIGMPQTLLVDPSGEIVWRQFGPLELESFRHMFSNRVLE